MPRWEENIRKVVPYTPGEQPKEKDIIKLNTNENPYPPSPAVKEALESLNYPEVFDLMMRWLKNELQKSELESILECKVE